LAVLIRKRKTGFEHYSQISSFLKAGVIWVICWQFPPSCSYGVVANILSLYYLRQTSYKEFCSILNIAVRNSKQKRRRKVGSKVRGTAFICIR